MATKTVNTVECRYSAVQYNMIFHTPLHWLTQNINPNLDSQKTLHVTGEPWSVYCEEFGENWPCYNQCLKLGKKSCRSSCLESQIKNKIEEKSTKSSQSSSKVVGLGPADMWEFPTLVITAPHCIKESFPLSIAELRAWYCLPQSS